MEVKENFLLEFLDNEYFRASHVKANQNRADVISGPLDLPDFTGVLNRLGLVYEYVDDIDYNRMNVKE